MSCMWNEIGGRESKKIGDFGNDFKENAHVYAKEKNCVYRLVVTFSHPVTGKEETIVSERYSSNVEAYLKEGCVNVHYSEKGEHWVEIWNSSEGERKKKRMKEFMDYIKLLSTTVTTEEYSA